MSEPVQVALVGRPNAGKSSLFNRLTGGSAHVGNFPGVTVDVLQGAAALPDGRRVEIHDLPGLYLLDPGPNGSADERVAVEFLRARHKAGEPLVVVHVADASQLELHLRLTQEIQRLLPGLRLIVVATQRDTLELAGKALDTAALAKAIGAPVVAVNNHDPDSSQGVLVAGSVGALASEGHGHRLGGVLVGTGDTVTGAATGNDSAGKP